MQTIRIDSIEPDNALYLLKLGRQMNRYVWVSSQRDGSMQACVDCGSVYEINLVQFAAEASPEDLARWPFGPTSEALADWLTMTMRLVPKASGRRAAPKVNPRLVQTEVLPTVK